MNECPLTIFVSPNSEEFGKQSVYPDGEPDRHRKLNPWTFHANPFGSFCAVANSQTDRQTTTEA